MTTHFQWPTGPKRMRDTQSSCGLEPSPATISPDRLLLRHMRERLASRIAEFYIFDLSNEEW